jgi:hypothetical protein
MFVKITSFRADDEAHIDEPILISFRIFHFSFSKICMIMKLTDKDTDFVLAEVKQYPHYRIGWGKQLFIYYQGHIYYLLANDFVDIANNTPYAPGKHCVRVSVNIF